MNDIHIRYEDPLTIPGHVFAVGMTMESLSARSTDDQWVWSINVVHSVSLPTFFFLVCDKYMFIKEIY